MYSFFSFIVLHSLSFCVSLSTVFVGVLNKNQKKKKIHRWSTHKISVGTFRSIFFLSYFIHRIESYFPIRLISVFVVVVVYLRLCKFLLNDIIPTQFFICYWCFLVLFYVLIADFFGIWNKNVWLLIYGFSFGFFLLNLIT